MDVRHRKRLHCGRIKVPDLNWLSLSCFFEDGARKRQKWTVDAKHSSSAVYMCSLDVGSQAAVAPGVIL